MGTVKYTIGRYSKTSYMVPQVNVPVFCIEELCYVLQENAFMLDDTICDENLTKWLDENCGLPELARQLEQLLRQKGSASAFAGIILDYTAYGTKEERREIEHLLRDGKDVDILVKKKNYANYLLHQKKYMSALQEYSNLCNQIPETNRGLRSEVLLNKGVVLCRMFYFQYAADVFAQSFEINPMNEQAAIQYLAAIRMISTPEEYITFIAENKQWYEYSLKLEKIYAEVLQDYAASEKKQEVRKLSVLKEKTKPALYAQMLEDKMAEMKREYREMAARQEK